MSSSKTPVVQDEFFQSLIGDFLDESEQLLDRLNENLLELDEFIRTAAPEELDCFDAELMNEMFRAAHSLKGLSAMLGLTDINQLTHKMENVFDAARRREFTFSPRALEVLFDAVDALVRMVEGLKHPQGETFHPQEVIDRIEQLLAAHSAEPEVNKNAESSEIHDLLEAVDNCNTPVNESSRDMPMDESSTAPQATTSVPDQPEPGVPDPFLGIVDETDIPAKYRSIFIDETTVSLDELTEILVSGDRAPGADATPQLLVTAHRIKGSAAAIGLNRVAKLAHVMEDVLQELRERQAAPSPLITDSLLSCSDALRTYIEVLKSSTPHADHFGELYHGLLAAHGRATSDSTDPNQTAAATVSAAGHVEKPASDATDCAAELEQIARMAPDATPSWIGQVAFETQAGIASLKAQLVCDKLSRLGNVFYCRPTPEQLDSLDNVAELVFGLATDESESTLAGQLNISGVRELCLTPIEVEPRNESAPETATAEVDAPAIPPGKAKGPTPPASRSGSTDAAPKRAAETLRVDIERLDHLMNLAGQLVISKARLSQIGEGLGNLAADKQARQKLSHSLLLLDRIETSNNGPLSSDATVEAEFVSGSARRIRADLEIVRATLDGCIDARQHLNDFFEAVHQLERVSDGIQKSVMDTRMVPIGPLFTRFRRVIRDISRGNGKEIDLVIRGEKTEMDKRMIDELSDPLIHMVRNSADHGIEPPDKREALGKPRRGIVTLDAFHRGNSIVMQVVDDGQGIDPDKIAKKAIEKNMITPADAERMSQHQILQLIWEPGFTTAEKVTDISGRGMGMDIVRQKIEQLSGTVDLESQLGQGTSFTVKLPLTLAILPSLMTEIEGEVFALPVESVAEIVSIRPEQLRSVHGIRTANVRGRIVSLVELAEVFNWASPPRRSASKQASEITLVVVGMEGRELGLAVDAVLGEEDVVIKSLAENYRNIPGIAGASILGDGRVALILDVESVIDMSTRLETSVAESPQEILA